MITNEDLNMIDVILRDSDTQTRLMTWEILRYEARLDMSARTIQRAM